MRSGFLRSAAGALAVLLIATVATPLHIDATLEGAPRSGDGVVWLPPEVEVLTCAVAREIADPATALELAQVVHSESRALAIDPLYALAIMKVESRFRADAVSTRGAIGLLQLRPIAARAVASTAVATAVGLRDPRTNVALGLRYLQKLEREFPDAGTALAAYNMGPTRIRQRMKARQAVPDGYARRVRAAYAQLSAGAPAQTALAVTPISDRSADRCGAPVRTVLPPALAGIRPAALRG
jgi:hypothetical protein